MVLAPEHPVVERITLRAQRDEVRRYVASARKASEIDRLSTDRAKSGVNTGAFAINPMNGGRIPIWIADYVLMTYGTGAIMAVPGHDQRDFEFAMKFGLPIKEVIAPKSGPQGRLGQAYVEPGVMVNSNGFDGLEGAAGIQAVAEDLEKGRMSPPPDRPGPGGTRGNDRLWGRP